MTQQETFDLVVTAMRKQGAPSAEGERCLYRGPNGLKCAAGCLIPDASYAVGMESLSASRGLVFEVLDGLGYNPYFVRELQKCHDGAVGFVGYTPELSVAYDYYKLNIDAFKAATTWLECFLALASGLAVVYMLNTDSVSKPPDIAPSEGDRTCPNPASP